MTPTTTRRRPGKKAPTLMEVIAEHQKTQKRKRRTPARVLIRRLLNKKTRGTTLLALALVVAGGVVLASRYLPLGAEAVGVAVGVALGGFLLLCEAWPELARWAFQNRRMLTPFVALALMVLPEVAVYVWPRPALMVALAGLVFVAYAHLNLWLRRLDHSHAAGYIPRAWLPMAYLATGWTVLAARFGLSTTTLGVLLLAWLTWAGWFWFENRTRTSHQLPLAKLWAEHIASPDSDLPDKDKLVGSKLTNVRAVPGGYAARVVLPPSQRGTKLDGMGEVIAQVANVPVTAVTIDQVPGGAAGQRDLLVLPKAITNKVIKWKGSDLDLTTWRSTVGTYIDGDRVKYVWCRAGSGPWHDLISGTTDSGKSRLIDLLLATSRSGSAGHIVDWVLDPQNGQSLPDWQEEVDWFASGVDEGMKMLRAAKAVMYARNLNLGSQKWEDDKGRQRRGVKGFTPTREMPLLVLTIEEAHAILSNDEAKAIVEDLSKMARKCGIKLRLVTQVPTLSQLGNSNVLRSMVASGNVLVLRTGNKSDGGFAFQGALQVDPVSIPREMPDGSTSAGLGFALGSQSRQAPMRTDFVEDPLDHCVSPIARLDAFSANHAGTAYALQFAVSTAEDGDVIEGEVISDVPTEPPVPVEGVVVRGPGGVTCADRATQLVKAAANRADNPHASVSKGDVAGHLLVTWKLGMVNRAIKELCEDPRQPVWSDDGRTTLYYKEAS